MWVLYPPQKKYTGLWPVILSRVANKGRGLPIPAKRGNWRFFFADWHCRAVVFAFLWGSPLCYRKYSSSCPPSFSNGSRLRGCPWLIGCGACGWSFGLFPSHFPNSFEFEALSCFFFLFGFRLKRYCGLRRGGRPPPLSMFRKLFFARGVAVFFLFPTFFKVFPPPSSIPVVPGGLFLSAAVLGKGRLGSTTFLVWAYGFSTLFAFTVWFGLALAFWRNYYGF